jgi:hypothetical protein
MEMTQLAMDAALTLHKVALVSMRVGWHVCCCLCGTSVSCRKSMILRAVCCGDCACVGYASCMCVSAAVCVC